jgi:hypothetical protein
MIQLDHVSGMIGSQIFFSVFPTGIQVCRLSKNFVRRFFGDTEIG